MEKIVHYGCLFVYENFHKQIPLKLLFLSPFIMLQSLWQVHVQVRNVFQSTIALFKRVSISQHNESLGCYSPLIA
jgi:hypothetical protein